MGINVDKRAKDIEADFDRKFYNKVIEEGGSFIRDYKGLDMNYIYVINIVALSYMKIGKTEEAFRTFKIILDIPNCYSPEVYSNFLLNINYLDTLTKEQKYKCSKDYERYLVNKGNIKINALDSNKINLNYNDRIRIGYFSSDFRVHPVINFITPILMAHDKSKFEIYCYYDFDTSDNATEVIKELVENWRSVYKKSNSDLKQCIQDDKIDILIDLAGHTEGGRRLPIFAEKLAPIQITYMGYPNTTGLMNMNYRITDAYADDEDSQKYYSEKLIKKENCFLCYRCNDDLPDIKLSNFEEFPKKDIVFGSFNNYSKITEKCIKMWSEILNSIPNSKLHLKSLAFYDKESAKNIYSRFEKYDIDCDRIIIIYPTSSINEHLDKYNEIDIALDAYPYNGTTTTCEAMIMGVPVITLSGEEHLSRVGKSILINTGFSGLIAYSEEEYIQKAIALAKNKKDLYRIKKNLRDKMLSSYLMNEKEFTREFEMILKGLWNMKTYKTLYHLDKEDDKKVIYTMNKIIDEGLQLFSTINEGYIYILDCLKSGQDNEEVKEIVKLINEFCSLIIKNYKFLSYRNEFFYKILNGDFEKITSLLQRVYNLKDYENVIKVIEGPLNKLVGIAYDKLLIEKQCLECINKAL